MKDAGSPISDDRETPNRSMTFEKFMGAWAVDHNADSIEPGKVTIGWLHLAYHFCRLVAVPRKWTPVGVEVRSLLAAFCVIGCYALIPLANAPGRIGIALGITFLTIFTSLMDNVDGGVARWTNNKQDAGSFIDLIFDRFSDTILYLAPLAMGSSTLAPALFAILTLYLFEGFRSMHMAIGIPMRVSLFERSTRLFILAVYPVWMAAADYLWSLLGLSTTSFLIAYIDWFFIGLGCFGLVGFIQIWVPFWKKYPPENIFLAKQFSLQDGMTERIKQISDPFLQNRRREFVAQYKATQEAICFIDLGSCDSRQKWKTGQISRVFSRTWQVIAVLAGQFCAWFLILVLLQRGILDQIFLTDSLGAAPTRWAIFVAILVSGTLLVVGPLDILNIVTCHSAFKANAYLRSMLLANILQVFFNIVIFFAPFLLWPMKTTATTLLLTGALFTAIMTLLSGSLDLLIRRFKKFYPGLFLSSKVRLVRTLGFLAFLTFAEIWHDSRLAIMAAGIVLWILGTIQFAMLVLQVHHEIGTFGEKGG